MFAHEHSVTYKIPPRSISPACGERSGPAAWRCRPGCVLPLKGAEFEQKVLNERGLAQVGSGFIFPPFVPNRLFTEGGPVLDLVPSHCGSRAPLGYPPSTGVQEMRGFA